MIEGHFVYRNLAIAQNPDTYYYFKVILDIIKPSQILEIGTFHGGLTLMLYDIITELGLATKIKTYDIEEQQFLKPIALSLNNMEVITKNLFNNSYDSFADEFCKKEITDYINQDGTTVVLCDGGCKKCEIDILSSLLKNNDIIMGHDYAPNQEYFDIYMRDKIWNWLELNDSDIQDTCKINNLYPYYQNLMVQIAWCCRKKILDC